MANPRYRDDIPLMIGGGGEKKTFAIAARCADYLNIIAGLDELPGKMKALAARCDEAGRDRSTLQTTAYVTVIINEDIKPEQINQIPNAPGYVVAGSPASIAEQVQAKVFDVGVDGVILSLAAHGYTPGVITTAAEALRPLVGL
jgi:alkanesulfonate monooxygenase SsuD/methylene tetrahydromethanopterin reductase-like flavin-dependent oxidoreductase (luciferase family)